MTKSNAQIAAEEADKAYRAQKDLDDAENLRFWSEQYAREKAESDARWESEEAAASKHLPDDIWEMPPHMAAALLMDPTYRPKK